MRRPRLSNTVIYRSRTGRYDLAAMVSADTRSLYRLGVEEGNLPDLTDERHVHLAVFTPGLAGRINSTTPPEDYEAMRSRSTPAGGTYQEFDVPEDQTGQTPGSWRWPTED